MSWRSPLAGRVFNGFWMFFRHLPRILATETATTGNIWKPQNPFWPMGVKRWLSNPRQGQAESVDHTKKMLLSIAQAAVMWCWTFLCPTSTIRKWQETSSESPPEILGPCSFCGWHLGREVWLVITKQVSPILSLQRSRPAKILCKTEFEETAAKCCNYS